MDNTRSSKVNDSNSTERIISEGRQESSRTPDGADNNGVDKSSKKDRVAKVGLHLATLGHSSGHNGSSSRREGKLKEPIMVILARKIGEEEVIGSNESLLASVSKGVTNSKETNGSTASIQKVLEHNIFDILLTDRSST